MAGHPGCAHCYAEKDRSVQIHDIKWGSESQGGTRVRLSDAGWKEPLKWNRKAAGSLGNHAPSHSVETAIRPGLERPRVFCASLCDVFEDWQHEIRDHEGNILHRCPAGHMVYWDSIRPNGIECGECEPKSENLARLLTMDDIRRDLFRLIDATPHLDWLLLTKRPENILKMWPAVNDKLHPVGFVRTYTASELAALEFYRPNVWIGTSVSDQNTADKNIPELLKCRDLSPILFLSAEPLLGPIVLDTGPTAGPPRWLSGEIDHEDSRLDLIITGGESGPKARVHDVQWSRDIGQQCLGAGVAWFHKQHGSNAIAWTEENGRTPGSGPNISNGMKDKKGGDPSEWEEFFRVRQMPKVNHVTI